jgi:1-acyl-sn-glycerol-3-phosphate acyltransferase
VPHFLAKDSVFKGLAGTILRAAGQIPVSRGSADARSSISEAQQALADGHVVVIYPEGSVTRDPTWWPMQARTGVARLALTTDAVVVPVAQWGPQRVHDYHTKKLHLRLRAPADYLVGEPVDLSDLRAEVRAGLPLTNDLLRETTDMLMSRVRDLLGELRGENPPDTFYTRPRAEHGDVPGTIGEAPGSAA